MIERLLDLVLGTDPKQRICTARTLGGAGSYTMCVVVEYIMVQMGMVNATHALLLCALIVLGFTGFYVLIRSGRTLHRADPSLTMSQMVFAILTLTFAYVINPQIRGILPMNIALVLVFGAFTLPPLRCRQLSWLAVICLAIAMVTGSLLSPQSFEARIDIFYFLLAALVLPAIGSLAAQLSALRIKQHLQKNELRAALDKVRELATRDELTGLPNRRYAYELWSHEQQRAKRSNTPICIGMLDIDHFKHINDTLGHQARDDALRMLSRILSKGLRAGDVLVRWGGEEFMLILPDTPIQEAHKVTERMRLRCADPENWLENPTVKVTFSAGVTAQVPGEPRDATIARADAALYAAKRQGRDRVMVG